MTHLDRCKQTRLGVKSNPARLSSVHGRSTYKARRLSERRTARHVAMFNSRPPRRAQSSTPSQCVTAGGPLRTATDTARPSTGSPLPRPGLPVPSPPQHRAAGTYERKEIKAGRRAVSHVINRRAG